MMKMKVSWSLVILIVLGTGVLIVSRMQDAESKLKNVTTFNEITFDRPAEFIFEESTDQIMKLDLRPDILDVLNFSGEIRIFHDFDHYKESGFLPSYIINSQTNLPQPVSRTDGYDDLMALGGKQTVSGNDMIELGYSDAGGLRVDYLIRLSEPNSGRSALLDVHKWTYEDPDTWSVQSDQHRQQHEMLNRLFEQIVSSAKFK